MVAGKSVAVFVLLLLILFGPLAGTWAPYSVVNFTFYCMSFSWLWSTAWGWYAVKRKDSFPKLTVTSSILFMLSLSSLMLLFVALGPLRFEESTWQIREMAIYSGAVWCLASIFITLFVIIKEVRDTLSWVILMTQVFWAAAAFFFYVLAGAIIASC
jgi:hypothetical protein